MAQFDKHFNSYTDEVKDSIGMFSESYDYFTFAKYELLKESFITNESLDILDVGCGVGNLHTYFEQDKIKVHGIDISGKSIQVAQEGIPTNHYLQYDGKKIPFEDDSFDLVFTVCVVHHVPPKEWRNFLSEMKRVTKKGGHVCIIEHNPLNPLTLRAVNNCEFDADAVLLNHIESKDLFKSVGMTTKSKFFLFFPFSSKLLKFISNALSWLPLGAQYISYAQKR